MDNMKHNAPTRNLRITFALTVAVILLATIAAYGGLFVTSLYRDSDWAVRAMRGQDLYTLVVAVPAMIVTLIFFRRGSVRAELVLAGLLGYILYTYTGAAFAFAFNEFYLIYVALFTLSTAALTCLLTGIDLTGLVGRFRDGTPRRAVAIFLTVIAFMLGFMELAQIVPFITQGILPEPLELSGGSTFFVYTLDLGVIMPLSLLSALWLWRRLPWGYVLAGCMLIKCAAMGFALLVTNAYAWRVGGATDAAELLFGYSLIGFGGLAMSVWFFRHCKETA